jgi:peptide/nickel transport system substrate-binding protein
VPGHINLQAVNGNPDYYRTCASFFICGTPMETDAGQTR